MVGLWARLSIVKYKKPEMFFANQGIYTEAVMRNETNILRGTIHGKTIELEREPGLPDGQLVSVTLQPTLPSGGLRRSFGSWSGDASELDGFIDRVRRDRQHGRSESGA